MRNPLEPLRRPISVARIFFVLITTLTATLLAWDTRQDPMVFSIGGFAFAAICVAVEMSTAKVPSRKIVIGACGLLAGMVGAQLFYPTFGWLAGLIAHLVDTLLARSASDVNRPRIPRDVISVDSARFICHLFFGYFGLVLALRHADWLRLGNLKLFLANPADRPKTLDSSVIIDGRIVDLISLGMLQGPTLIPQFVLREIQGLADSADANRRARGKRGLDVLDRLRTCCRNLDIVDKDYPDLRDVDQKLVRLCRELNAELMTNDANLQKIAQLHQVPTLNLNELAEAMRPTVFVGETLNLKILKPGKEHGQGIGYLEDGAMVVVENGEKLVGQDREIAITSILQNPTGRIIFAKLSSAEERRERTA